MPAPVLATKLFIPPTPPNNILRPRLVNRLTDGLHRKLTLVSAPPGFGKTTLVSEWVQAMREATPPRAVVWLSLDGGDKETARFFTYLVAALQALPLDGNEGISANVGTSVLGMLQSPQPPPAEAILTALLNDITAYQDNFALILDDYHLIETELVDGSSSIDKALTFLLEHQPSNMHLVILTRQDPQLPLARLRAKGQLTELRSADLRFSSSEAAGFLNDMMGLALSPDDIAALETRTEGWIAGLQLAAISMQGLQDRAGFIHAFTGSHRFVLDYLLEEVLDKQTEAIQTFLLRTSILERMCGALCDQVIDNSTVSGQDALELLEHANLFIVPLDHDRRWYRYHHLFRDLLRQRLTHKASPEQIAGLNIFASEWLEANGDIAEAFHHAIAAADVGRAARLAESAWQAMNESFQMITWLGWVNQLSPGETRVRPVLCTQIGLAYMDTGDIAASEASLRDAEDCLRLPPGDMIIVENELFQTLPLWIAFARAYNAQSQHRFSDAIRYAEIALDLTPREDEFMYAQVSTLLMGTHWATGSLDVSCKLMNDWVEASTRAGKLFFAIAGAFGKADILNSQGRLRDVQETYQEAIKFASVHNAEQHTAHHHLGLAMLYHEMGEDERAGWHLQKSFDIGTQTTIVDWAYRKRLAQAQLKESEGDLVGALDLLDEAERHFIRTPTPNLRPVDAMQARIYLRQGKVLKAQEWATKSAVSLDDTPDFLHEYERLTLAMIMLAGYQKDRNEQLFHDVLGLLEGQLRLAEKQNRLRSRIEILILQALAYHTRGEAVKALDSLEQALTLAEPEGYLRIFAAQGKPMVEMLSKLNNSNLNPYARRILAFLEPPHEDQSKSTRQQPLIEPLSERELEVLHLIAQGLSNQEITQKLFVALSTVKGHNLRIFAKLQAKSRTEAVARARELGLL